MLWLRPLWNSRTSPPLIITPAITEAIWAPEVDSLVSTTATPMPIIDRAAPGGKPFNSCSIPLDILDKLMKLSGLIGITS